MRRRPTLPNGRTVAGGFLVAAAAVVVFGAWLQASGGHGRSWVVARQQLAAGSTLEPGELTTSTMRLPAATSAHAFGGTAALVGQKLAAPLAPGELVQTGDLVAPSSAPTVRPVAVSVDPVDAATLATGDLVDVLVTDGTNQAATTDVVIYRARVLDVGRTSDNVASSTAGVVITLGVHSFAEVRAVVHAAATGKVTVVEGEPSDGAGVGPGGGGSAPSGNPGG